MTQTIAAFYDSDNQKVVFNKDISLDGNINMTGNITAAGIATGNDVSITIQNEGQALTTGASTLNFTGGGVAATGDGATKTITVAGGSVAGSEYFQAYLTDYQTNINNLGTNSDTWTILDFEGKGAQTGNTANWNASTNSYTLGSTGLYQISFQIYFTNATYRDVNNTTKISGLAEYKDIGVYVEYSADNWSSSAIAFAGGLSATQHSIRIGKTISGTYLFSPTSASTKIRLRGAADPQGSNTTVIISHVIKPFGAIQYDFDYDYYQSQGTTIPDDNKMGETLQPASFFNVVRLS